MFVEKRAKPFKGRFRLTAKARATFWKLALKGSRPPEERSIDGPYFRHQPLNSDKDEIRLFKLVDGANDLDICCELETFSLGSCPEFTAVSYQWGPAKPRYSITINGSPFSVRANLANFLLTMNEEVWPDVSDDRSIGYLHTWLWCDQICIDQANVQEKNHQVGLMDRIYSAASATILWLGDRFEGGQMTRKLRMYQERSERQTSIFKVAIQRSYWSRLWIIQEIWFSKNIFLMVGHWVMTWEWFANLVKPLPPPPGQEAGDDYSFDTFGYQISDSFRHQIPMTIRTLVEEKRHFDDADQRLSYIINAFGGLECQVLHDTVFGLLGLVPEDRRIEIDYSATLQEVYDAVMAKVRVDEFHISDSDHRQFAKYLRSLLGLHETS